MGRYRRYSVEFKRQVVEEFHAGETPYHLSKRYNICHKLIPYWAARNDAGAFDSDASVDQLMQQQAARIAALERLVGRLSLENDFLKTASRHARRKRSASASVIVGPPASPSPKDAD